MQVVSAWCAPLLGVLLILFALAFLARLLASTAACSDHQNGSRYVSWLPSFSVEVTRVRAPPTPPHQLQLMARQVQQLFPQYGVGVLIADLTNTRSADLTVNNILEGRLPLPPAPAPLVPEPPPSAPAPAPAQAEWHDVSDISASEILHVARVLPAPPARDAATNTAPSPPAPALSPPPAVPPAAAHAPHYVYHTDVGHSSTMFSKDASEREMQLQRRKQQLIAAARQKYLDKQTHAHTHTSTHPAPAPHTPPAQNDS